MHDSGFHDRDFVMRQGLQGMELALGPEDRRVTVDHGISHQLELLEDSAAHLHIFPYSYSGDQHIKLREGLIPYSYIEFPFLIQGHHTLLDANNTRGMTSFLRFRRQSVFLAAKSFRKGLKRQDPDAHKQYKILIRKVYSPSLEMQINPGKDGPSKWPPDR